MIRKLLALLIIASPIGALEPDPAGYERILLPVVVQARPGAFGSVWRTELTVRNEADVSAHVFQQACGFFCTCEVMVLCSAGEIPAHNRALGGTIPANNPANVGVFVYVNRPRANELAIQLRVRDVSRQDESWGTEVPVVRDREMRLGTTYLLDVPITGGVRQHLRVYGASSSTGTGAVIVRVFPNNGNALLAERVLTLVQGAVERDGRTPPIPADHELPAVPAYAELPSLRDALPAGTTEPVRLEITPATAGLKYWAMVSITNNTTQHVTLITPQ